MLSVGGDISYPCRVKVKKGGSAFIPGLKTGDFSLRPLHPRELNGSGRRVGVVGDSFKKNCNRVYRCRAKSSGSIRASLRTPRRVPILSSLWSGTTVPTFPSGVCFESRT